MVNINATSCDVEVYSPKLMLSWIDDVRVKWRGWGQNATTNATNAREGLLGWFALFDKDIHPGPCALTVLR
jgi:hypothetical protein